MVHCETQEEIDHYWESSPRSLKRNAMDEMLKDEDEKKIARVAEAFLKMKKFDVDTLKRAYEGK